MEILVRIKNVYGTDLVYPVCDKAKIFARLAAQKTLTDWTITQIKELGYTIKVETPKL